MTKHTEELLERGSYFKVRNPVFPSSTPMKSIIKTDIAKINVLQIGIVFGPESPDSVY